MSRRPDATAFLILLLGGTCIGFAPVLVRLTDVGPIASAFWRTCLAAPLLWTALRISNLSVPRQVAGGRESVAAVAGWTASVWWAGVFFAADLGAWHFSLSYTTVANATLLANTAPLLATIYLLVVRRHRPQPRFLLALGLAMTGAVALVSPKLQVLGSQWRGDALALLAAIFYTAYMLTIKHARGQFDTLRLMALTTTITAIALLPVAVALSYTMQQPFWPHDAHGWLVLVALAVLTQCAGQGCIAYALAHLPVNISTTGLLIQPVVAASAAWWLFGEQLGLWQLLGAAVLLCALVLAQRSVALEAGAQK